MKIIYITGAPRCGKTTLTNQLKRIIKNETEVYSMEEVLNYLQK